MRITEKEYFFEIAEVVSKRATCPRLAVGAILVRDGRIISTGYNGALPHAPHCIDIGCDIVDNHCIRVNHAEVNTILSAAKAGISTKGSVMYATHLPCFNCFKAIVTAGVPTVYYKTPYRPDARTITYLQQIGGDYDENLKRFQIVKEYTYADLPK